MCDEIIEETKLFQQILYFILYFTSLFSNYYSIIDSCQYLLLSENIEENEKSYNITNKELKEIMY